MKRHYILLWDKEVTGYVILIKITLEFYESKIILKFIWHNKCIKTAKKNFEHSEYGGLWILKYIRKIKLFM